MGRRLENMPDEIEDPDVEMSDKKVAAMDGQAKSMLNEWVGERIELNKPSGAVMKYFPDVNLDTAIQRVRDLVQALNSRRGSPSAREWMMRIPIQKDDPDVIVFDLIRAALKCKEALEFYGSRTNYIGLACGSGRNDIFEDKGAKARVALGKGRKHDGLV